MKTNLERTILSRADAHKFLKDLCDNDEIYHPDDDAHDIIFEGLRVTKAERDCLNSLMGSVFEFDQDPCDFILTYNEMRKKRQKYTLGPHKWWSGRASVVDSEGKEIATVRYRIGVNENAAAQIIAEALTERQDEFLETVM